MTTAYLIDPVNRTVELVEVTDLDSIYKAMNVELVQSIPVADFPDVPYVDEEGTFKDGNKSFFFRGWAGCLFGRGLVVGADDGNDVDPKTPFVDVTKMVGFNPQYSIGEQG